ncbi:uroporphyrinogen-III C-methyltransferase [Salinimicrobium marinum]|uniref:uroporphyrinogen-III C-methyltransferase n=1 Tax=Salinimicrobium marinum TaxID=680283 RepID=A0A918S7T3_9FLAO|nr:uroporphyrinogen-III C-methyltransferase [Salinimicrobium marinum]GHA27714.1 uroporphyrinogen-III C-methyltransferase [Salinimicrobium marinum]
MKARKKIHPKLTLVGAGPGGPDLLTIKAVKALEAADVVLYDALVNPVILNHAPNAYKLFVGKRKGCHSCAQDQINELIVKYAREYGHVVRLKGGDPFVFGRGKEEKDYAEARGIVTEFIPGITSATAVPAMAGIPVTERKVSESFWVITGTTSNHKISKDVALAAQSSATVVILMGMAKLSEIVDIYKKAGKPELPVAIIQNGTLEDQHVETGSVETIEEIVYESKISSPAIIVLGEVVKGYSERLPKINFLNPEDEFIYQNLGVKESTV